MSLTLYYHPLSSFCWKTLIALYDSGIPFEPKLVNLGDPAERAAFQAVWPLAKFPVLRDEALGHTVPESTIIIEYLAQHYPAAAGLLPADPDLARQFCRPGIAVGQHRTGPPGAAVSVAQPPPVEVFETDRGKGLSRSFLQASDQA